MKVHIWNDFTHPYKVPPTFFRKYLAFHNSLTRRALVTMIHYIPSPFSFENKEESIANHSNHESRILITEQIPPPEHNTVTMAPAGKCNPLLNKTEEQKDESPSSWRLSLRKTSSQNALSEGSMPCDTLKEKGSSIYYSSSTPRISALLDNQEKQDKDNRIYFASISPRRLNNTGDIEEKENRESAVNLVRSGPYSRQQWKEDPKGNEAPTTGAPSTYVSTYMKRAPYRQQTDSTTEKSTEAVSSSIPLSVITNLTVPGSSNGVTTTNSNSLTETESSTGDARDRRRSYLTPVRDEEAESLRKARSRQARQTRRSTQGITLTDLQEAEKTFSRSRAERFTQEQPSERSDRLRTSDGSCGKQEDIARTESREFNSPWTKNVDEESSSRRLRYLAQQDKPTTAVSPSLTSSLYSSSHMPKTNRFVSSDSLSSADYQSTSAGNMEKNEYESQDLDERTSNKQSVRERRRPKERRRGTGISFFTKDDEEIDGTEEVMEDKHERLSRLDSASSSTGTIDTSSDRPSGRSSAYTRRAALSNRTEDDSIKDYKKLYEGALSENQKLKSKLQDAQVELADIKSKMDKLNQQKLEKSSDRSSMLEMEKREKRALERKLSEMEEEMKVLTELKSDNQRLKDENGALIRVISKLSK